MLCAAMNKTRVAVVRREGRVLFERSGTVLAHDLPVDTVDALPAGERDVMCVAASGGLHVVRLFVSDEVRDAVTLAEKRRDWSTVIGAIGAIDATTIVASRCGTKYPRG
jgi:hypothetical protein